MVGRCQSLSSKKKNEVLRGDNPVLTRFIVSSYLIRAMGIIAGPLSAFRLLVVRAAAVTLRYRGLQLESQ